MQPELHERARLLLDRGMMESIPAEKQRWLDHHLSECAECSRHAELNRRAIQALDSFAFDLDDAIGVGAAGEFGGVRKLGRGGVGPGDAAA